MQLRLTRALRPFARLVAHPRSFVASRLYRWELRRRRGSISGPLVLVIRNAGIGDIVCTFPAVLALRAKYPGCYIVYECFEPFVPIVQMAGCADDVAAVPLDGSFAKIDPRMFDVVLRPTNPDEDQSDRPHGHLVDNFASTMDVSLHPRERQPRIDVPPELQLRTRSRLQRAGAVTKPLIAIHTGPSWAVREWRAEEWPRLVAALKATCNATVIRMGDKPANAGKNEEAPIADTIDLRGELAITESIALLKLCDYLIGIDSGLLHLAGAVGTPTLGLFGPVRPDYRLPPDTPAAGAAVDLACIGCHHYTPPVHWRTGCPIDIECMRTLSVERVLESFRALQARVSARTRTDATSSGV